MLRIAIPNKGALSEGALQLVKDAGYRCRRDDRELIAIDREHEVEFIFLRPRDIAVYVGNGTLDLGITGRDLALDSGADVKELLPLGFARASFYYAAPRDSGITLDGLAGRRIATSYEHLVRADLEKRSVDARVINLDGAVEISVWLGVAEVIADVVQSGKTLEQAGLKTIGAPILESEAVLIGRNETTAEENGVRIFMERLRGIVVAREYAMIEYDIHNSNLNEAIKLTPGIEAPTISGLTKKEWSAVKAMTSRKGINRTMDDLKELGARGIIVTDIRFCRL